MKDANYIVAGSGPEQHVQVRVPGWQAPVPSTLPSSESSTVAAGLSCTGLPRRLQRSC